MPDPAGWIEKFSQRVLSWFSQREVKTPLAFYFRLVGALVVLVIAAIFAVPDRRFEVFIVGVIFLFVLAVIVGLFTCFNVKNLVYGESGHRAESKFRLVTEKREFGPSEVDELHQTQNPNALPSPGGFLPEGGGRP